MCVFLVLNVPLYVSDDDKHTINSCLLLKTTLFNNITHPFFMRFFSTIYVQTKLSTLNNKKKEED